MSNAEVILWSRLRRKAINGQRCRRQHPIGPYVADFSCLPLRVIVEIDGATHATDEEIAHDIRRDAYLRRHGFRVLRFWNRDVYENLDGVLEEIWNAVAVDEHRPR